jgi:UDP-N-acetylmuramate--alanine ligase
MTDKLHYHLIGIGGSGMSAIAHILHGRGEVVSGSDRQENDATRRLRAEGVKVSIGHSVTNVGAADVVVYSAAIPVDNPEILEARMRGVPTLERPAMLGRLMEPYEHRIAVSGTHGKTTTTSMINMIFDRAELDASALIGGDLKSLGGNARLGGGSIILTEACEAFESFLHLHPSIAVITNIDADHLDYYGTIENIEDSFRQFVSQVDEDGCVVACWDDPRVRKVLEGCGRRIVRFGLEGDLDVLATDVDTSTPEPSYTLVHKGEALGTVRVGVPGLQNVTDSLAAAAVAFEMGVEFDAIADGLADFRGAGRRFEVLHDDGDLMVVDDYAHHPSEIKATLSAARAAYDKRIIAVFQPHLYSRTKLFQQEFAEALALADEVIVAPIYAAREQPMEGVCASNIVHLMKKSGFERVRYARDKATLSEELVGSLRKGDMVLVLGAGDIRMVSERLAELLDGRRG